jgi:hypothetical protein
VERLLKRKNAGVLSPSALALVKDGEDDEEEGDEGVLRKKTGKQAHMR